MADFFTGAGSALIGLLPSLFGSNTSGSQATNSKTNATSESLTSTLSPEIISMLEELVKKNQFSKDAAIKDSQAMVTNAIQQALRTQMPGIGSATKQAGLGNASMTDILARQTADTAAIQGAGLQLDAINSYQANFSNLINTLIAGSDKKTKTKSDTTQQANSTTSSEQSMCFITTIVCDYLGYDDDCEVMRVLRWYRDNWLATQDDPEIKEALATYDMMSEVYAPVLHTLAGPRKEYLFSMWYRDALVPAKDNILVAEYDAAFSRYKNLVKEVKEVVETELKDAIVAVAAQLENSDGGTI